LPELGRAAKTGEAIAEHDGKMQATHRILNGLSGVVPTKARAQQLWRTFHSLAEQSAQPAKIIVVDASDDLKTRQVCEEGISGLYSEIQWIKAKRLGAAGQRTEGVCMLRDEFVWFFDDDILFEDECILRLWLALQGEARMGGVNAAIVNQRYQAPGTASRLVFSLMNGRREKTFAGKVIGPAINLLPEDGAGLADVVPVEWLNTTCTMYRREALPSPTFDPFFVGYSLMEDLTLSLRVVRNGWKLANIRNARIFHDSQPGEHKSNVAATAAMELVNRHYVMTRILERRGVLDYLRLFLWEAFQLAVCAARTNTRHALWPEIRGKLCGLKQILHNG
jgi:GT2 family glycosyltransferase